MKMFSHSGDQIKHQNGSEQLVYLVLFIGLWAYIWLRAIYTQMTHDETANFFRFVHTGDFLPYGLDTSATNHLLNSFLAWIFYSLFGAEPVVLRLSNVLFFPVFFWFLVRLAALMQSRFLRIGFVAVLALTHNLIEFFAMSRGYGHSMALLLGAFWFLIQSVKTPTFKNYTLALIFAGLALAANLTLLNSVILVIFFLALRIVIKTDPVAQNPWRNWISIFLFGIFPLVFFAKYLFHLKALGDLYYGELSGFWEITVRSLNRTMLDPGWHSAELFIAIYVVLVLVSGIYLFFRKFNISRFFDPKLFFFYFLLGNTIAVFLLNKLLGVNYPEDRTGLYFVVYFIGSIFFLADYLATTMKLRWVRFTIIPLFFIPFHFFLNSNFNHNSFESQTIPQKFYNRVLADHQPGEVPPTIGGYMGRELRWAFLNYKNDGSLGKVQGHLYPDTLCDYQIADTNYPATYFEWYDTVDFYAESSFYLLRRKEQAKVVSGYNNSGIETTGEISDAYFRFFIIDADTLAGKYVRIDFDFKLETEARPFMGWLIANSLNAQNQQTGYEYFPLEWLKASWDDGGNRVVNALILKLPEDLHQLNFYIWNKQEVPFSVAEGNAAVRVYK